MTQDDTPPARKRRRTPEHTFQSWCDRLIDRIVLQPMFTTGIDAAHVDSRKIGRIASLQARGIRFGLPDLYVAQSGRSVWIELKRGSQVSATQAAVHAALTRAGQHVAVAHNMVDVLDALRTAGFTLHANADALAAEYEMRVQAREAAPAAPRKPTRPQKPRITPSHARRVEQVRGRVGF